MRIIRKILIGIFAVVGLLAAAFVLLALYSVTERAFVCTGVIETGAQKRSATIYLRLDEYAWWAGLLSKSRGRLLFERDDRLLFNFFHLENLGSVWHIHEDEGKALSGSLSKLSGKLLLNTGYDLFDGVCAEKKSEGR